MIFLGIKYEPMSFPPPPPPSLKFVSGAPGRLGACNRQNSEIKSLFGSSSRAIPRIYRTGGSADNIVSLISGGQR